MRILCIMKLVMKYEFREAFKGIYTNRIITRLKFMPFIAFLGIAQAKAKSTEDIYNETKGSIVLIISYDKTGKPISTGSGFFIKGNQIATNFHVIEGSSDLRYKGIHDQKIHGISKVLTFSKSLDLAILSTTDEKSPLSISPNLFDRIGAKVIAIGNPKGLTGTVSEGIISGVRKLDSFTFLQTTAPISPGSSGGPLFNESGEVVGVTSLVLGGSNSQNLNFAIPSHLLLELGQKRGISETPLTPIPPTSKEPSLAARDKNLGSKNSQGNRFGRPWAGVFVLRYTNGQKKEEIRYRDGHKNGIATYWYLNGVKSKQSQWRNGKPDGLWISWDNSGRVTKRSVYRNGTEFK
jgi:S1-C subfamily serine protease